MVSERVKAGAHGVFAMAGMAAPQIREWLLLGFEDGRLACQSASFPAAYLMLAVVGGRAVYVVARKDDAVDECYSGSLCGASTCVGEVIGLFGS